MRRNDGKWIELKTKLVYEGNWNYKDKTAEVVKGKPIIRVFMDNSDGLHYVFTHDDLLQLLDAYLVADEYSIALIKQGRAGNIKNFETPLKEKIEKLLKNHEGVWK